MFKTGERWFLASGLYNRIERVLVEYKNQK